MALILKNKQTTLPPRKLECYLVLDFVGTLGVSMSAHLSYDACWVLWLEVVPLPQGLGNHPGNASLPS